MVSSMHLADLMVASTYSKISCYFPPFYCLSCITTVVMSFSALTPNKNISVINFCKNMLPQILYNMKVFPDSNISVMLSVLVNFLVLVVKPKTSD
jgi:hypothetical protein